MYVYMYVLVIHVTQCFNNFHAGAEFNSLSPKLNSVDFRVAGVAILRCK